MAIRGQLQEICVRKNSTKTQNGDVLVIFFKVLLKFKMAAMDQRHIFLWPK